MNILIFCNCITEECLAMRNNQEYMAVASRKKILAMSEIMEKNGHRVDIFSSSYSKHSSLLFIQVLSGNTRVIHSPTIGFWGITSFFKKTVHTLFSIIWLLFHLKRYDSVIFYNYHVEYSIPAIFAKILSSIKIASPCKIIMDYEDGLFLDKGYKGFFYSTWEKFIYKNISHYLLVNQGLKNRIEKYCPANKNYVIINGLINDKLLDNNKAYQKGPIKKIMFSGNFSHGFGFEQLIQYIDNMDKNIQFFITGKASGNEIKEVLNRLQQAPHVKYYGFMKENEFNRLIQTIDAFILLNDENSEYNQTNFPSKFFDYLSRNKFIITSENSILSQYYYMQNIILIKNFPHDIRNIKQLSSNRETNYSEIQSLSLKTQMLLENFLTS